MSDEKFAETFKVGDVCTFDGPSVPRIWHGRKWRCVGLHPPQFKLLPVDYETPKAPE